MADHLATVGKERPFKRTGTLSPEVMHGLKG